MVAEKERGRRGRRGRRGMDGRREEDREIDKTKRDVVLLGE